MDYRYKVYVIKCKVTGQVFLGKTDSISENYNPIAILYKRYKQDNNKYKMLGEAISQHKFSSFDFTFLKHGLSAEMADEFIEECREKVKDRCLNDDQPSRAELFKDELSLFSS